VVFGSFVCVCVCASCYSAGFVLFCFGFVGLYVWVLLYFGEFCSGFVVCSCDFVGWVFVVLWVLWVLLYSLLLVVCWFVILLFSGFIGAWFCYNTAFWFFCSVW